MKAKCIQQVGGKRCKSLVPHMGMMFQACRTALLSAKKPDDKKLLELAGEISSALSGGCAELK